MTSSTRGVFMSTGRGVGTRVKSKLLLLIFFLSLIPFQQLLASSCSKLFTQTVVPSVKYAEIAKTIPSSRTDRSQLRVASYNVLMLVAPQSNEKGTNGEWKLRGNANTIRHIDADILFVQEIRNKPNFELFNRKYLDSAYKMFVSKNPDQIATGLLIRNELYEVYDFREIGTPMVDWKDPTQPARTEVNPLFHRPPLVVGVYAKGAPRGAKPIAILVGSHLKSQFVRSGSPPIREQRMRLKRQKQGEAMALLHQDLARRYTNRIIHAGDFNGDLKTDAPMKTFIGGAGLINGLDLSQQQLEGKDRITEYYMDQRDSDKDGKPKLKGSELDGILVTPEVADFVNDMNILRNLDGSGKRMEAPTSSKELNEQPSDHFPIWMDLEWSVLDPAAQGERLRPTG